MKISQHRDADYFFLILTEISATMKSSDPLFKETQYFRQWWLWISILPVTLFSMVSVWVFRDPKDPLWLLILINLILLALLALFFWVRLKTEITDESLTITYFPLLRRQKTVAWKDVDKAMVIKYHPIRDYGGWGVKYGPKGKVYNVSGNMGLMLELKNGKKMMLGTRRPEDLAAVIRRVWERNDARTPAYTS